MTTDTDQADALLQLSREVATHLGSEWTAHEESYNWKHVALLTRDDGGTLALSIWKGRVIVNGRYPRGISRLPELPKPITVALQRGPRVIAREIKRRYLPDYTESYIRATRQLHQAQDQEAARREALNGLADLIGVAITDIGEREIHLYGDDGSYGKVTLPSAEKGRVYLDAVPTGLLKALLRVYRDWGKEEGNG